MCAASGRGSRHRDTRRADSCRRDGPRTPPATGSPKTQEGRLVGAAGFEPACPLRTEGFKPSTSHQVPSRPHEHPPLFSALAVSGRNAQKRGHVAGSIAYRGYTATARGFKLLNGGLAAHASRPLGYAALGLRWQRNGEHTRRAPSPSARGAWDDSVALEVEAASGFEPLNRGFADLRLGHLATPPRRETAERTGRSGGAGNGIRTRDPDLARSCSTTELFPRHSARWYHGFSSTPPAGPRPRPRA